MPMVPLRERASSAEMLAVAMAAPVNLVNAESVRKTYGTRILLDDLSIGIAAGDRIGVVGRNGGGKSTLLRLLAKREPPDAGRVTHTGGLSIGWVGQADELDPAQTVRDYIVGDRPEHDWAGDARVREVLAALLGGVSLHATIGPLSGGERRRVALASVLVHRHGLLLLDEPTNHLDVEAIDWLGRQLAARSEAVVVVTHDRWFLDTVANLTWEVVDSGVEAYDGGYSAYVLAKAERVRIAAAEESRRQNLLRKELAWLRRGPPARTSKPRFRIAAAEELIQGEPPARDSLELAKFATARLGKTVVDLEDVSLAFGGRTLLDRITWQLGPGDRIGLVGVNGAGKTSLLRLLDGEVRADSGRVVRGRTVRFAHLSQEVTELAPTLRVLEAVEEIARVVSLGKGREATASQLLERFGFGRERQWTPVGDLSGGERRRLQLLRLLMAEPNVLLLDEPTNDLDIETLTVLEDLLDSWPGSLVVVSHDRWFLERVTDTVWSLLGDGALRMLPGGIDEYLRRRSELAAAAADGGAGARTRTGDTRAARRELARLERELDKLGKREARLHDEMAASATDHERVLALDTELRALMTERDELEERWLALAEDAG